MSMKRVAAVDLSWVERLTNVRPPVGNVDKAVKSHDPQSTNALCSSIPVLPAFADAEIQGALPDRDVSGEILASSVANAIQSAFGRQPVLIETASPNEGHPTLLTAAETSSVRLPRLLDVQCLDSPATIETPILDVPAEIQAADDDWAAALDSRLRQMADLAGIQPLGSTIAVEGASQDRYDNAPRDLEIAVSGRLPTADEAPKSYEDDAIAMRWAAAAQWTEPHGGVPDDTLEYGSAQRYATPIHHFDVPEIDGDDIADRKSDGVHHASSTAARSAAIAAGVVALGIAMTSVQSIGGLIASPAFTPANAEDLPALPDHRQEQASRLSAGRSELTSGAPAVQSVAFDKPGDGQSQPTWRHVSVGAVTTPPPAIIHEVRRLSQNGPEIESGPRVMVAATQSAAQPDGSVLERPATPPLRPRLTLAMTIPAYESARLPFPLAIEGLDAPAGGSRLVLRGLPEHTTLSRGRLAGPGEWHLPVAAARDLLLSVPPLSPGNFELLVELWSGDGALLSSGLKVVQVVPRPRPLAVDKVVLATTTTEGMPVAIAQPTSQSISLPTDPTILPNAQDTQAAPQTTERADSPGVPTVAAKSGKVGPLVAKRTTKSQQATMSRLGGPTGTDEKRDKPRNGGRLPGLFEVFDQGKGI